MQFASRHICPTPCFRSPPHAFHSCCRCCVALCRFRSCPRRQDRGRYAGGGEGRLRQPLRRQDARRLAGRRERLLRSRTARWSASRAEISTPTKEYANFVLRFEFKLPPAGNNGVGIRTPAATATPPTSAWKSRSSTTATRSTKISSPTSPTARSTASCRPNAASSSPPASGTQEEIVADGSHIKVTLNGTVIVDADLSKIDKTHGPSGPSGPAQRQGLHRLARPRRSGGVPQRADQGTAVGLQGRTRNDERGTTG